MKNCSNQFWTGQKQRSVSESILRQVVTDRKDSTQFKIAELTGAGDMLLKRESLVEGDAQVADSRRKMNRGSI